MEFLHRTKPPQGLCKWILLLVLLMPGALMQAQQPASPLLKKITISFTGEKMAAALQKIEKSAGLKLGFNAENMGGYYAPVISYDDKPLEQVLKGLFMNTSLVFKEVNGYIIINNKEAGGKPVKPLPVTNAGKVAGKVIDEETKQPVAGASIRIGKRGGVTDDNGNFSITLPGGTYTATVSNVGYALTEVPGILVKGDSTITFRISLQKDKRQLGEVTITADRVITTSNVKLVNDIKTATGVISGISSEQITITVDRSASEVARRVAGVTLQDGFISIRGMTPRYNPVYLNNAYLPSTDPNKRAFNFDLLPSSVIDRMIVYKSPAPELPADFAGGVVKVYTKKSVPVRRFEISFNAQYRTDNKFFSNHTQAGSGKYDWLGYDDGSRAMPANMPRNLYGKVMLPDIDSRPNAYTLVNERITEALLKRSTKSWNLQQIYHPADVQGDATYYTYFNLGKMKLNSVSVGRYENQRSYYRTNTSRHANTYSDTVFPAPGVPLQLLQDYNYRIGYDSVYATNVRLAAMQHLSLIIDAKNEISAMGLLNHSTKQVLQINTLQEWFTSESGSLFFRRMENAYNTQDIYLGMLNGIHKTGNDKHHLEWATSYSKAKTEDPNQFSNVYLPDAASIEGDRSGFGKLRITDSTTWQLYTGTRKNTVVGRFYDGEGNEQRWQGNLDYTLKPLSLHKEFFIKAGAYFESRRKNYVFSSLAYRDYPALSFSQNPWTNLGDSIQEKLANGGGPMHIGIQQVGVGGAETNGYKALFDNVAGYLAANMPLSFRWPFGNRPAMKLDIYGGVRLEYSKRRVYTTDGKELLEEYLPNSSGQQVLVGTAPPAKQYFWLPSVSARMHFNDYLQLRLSYGKTLNRPDLRELSPFITYNPAEGFTYLGKPTLHDARIDNYDLRLEWYPSAGETVSAGFYYKHLKEPIEETMASTNTGIPGFTHSNMPYARILGTEIEVRKQLSFLGDNFFRHMGLIVNACFNFTEASNRAMLMSSPTLENYYPGGNTRPFIGAAPWIVNAGLFYDHKRSGSRISLQYNVMADRVIMNTSGPNVWDLEPWVWERSRHLLDLSVLQKINKWLSVRVAAQNILNASIRHYVDNDFNKKFNTAPSYFEWHVKGMVYDVTEKYIQGDYYVRDYKPGVYYTLGFQVSL